MNPSDVTDTDDGTREKSKPAPCEDGLTQPKAEAEGDTPELDAEPEADVGAEPEAEAEAEVELDLDAKVEQEDAEPEEDAEVEPDLDTEAEPEEAELDTEADPDTDAVTEEAELDADAELDTEAELDAEAEPEEAEPDTDAETEAMSSSKEAEDDHISVIIPNEDAITLDVDGDDLLDTGKHVKLPDYEKSTDEPDASAEMEADDDDVNEEEPGAHKDEESRGEPTKKDGREALKAEMGDKDKDFGKKGPSTTGASGQAKRFVFLCQFFDSTTKSSTLRAKDFFFP